MIVVSYSLRISGFNFALGSKKNKSTNMERERKSKRTKKGNHWEFMPCLRADLWMECFLGQLGPKFRGAQCVRTSDDPITGRSASSSTLDENRAYASQVMRTKTPADALVS